MGANNSNQSKAAKTLRYPIRLQSHAAPAQQKTCLVFCTAARYGQTITKLKKAPPDAPDTHPPSPPNSAA
jgi:hypothetical protein